MNCDELSAAARHAQPQHGGSLRSAAAVEEAAKDPNGMREAAAAAPYISSGAGDACGTKPLRRPNGMREARLTVTAASRRRCCA